MFYQFVEILHELGEIKYENIFIDGTKIEANANRYTFVWKKAVEKNEEKMHLKISGIAAEIQKLYFKEFAVSKEYISADIKKMHFLKRKRKMKTLTLSMAQESEKTTCKSLWKRFMSIKTVK